MIRHSRVVTVAATLLCLGLAFVVIDSLSTVKYTSQRLSWKRTTESHQCPWTRSQKDSAAASRLFSISDFSSHPYSVYYGTSGSTAQQNFGQNDDFNDVYGYGPDDRMQEEPIHRGENTQLRSMQDIPLMDGRRGATVFGRRYNDERPHHRFYEDPRLAHERERMFHEERLMEDHHVMGEMDSLLHEREHLRNELDAVVQENMHLHNQNKMNGPPPGVPPPPPARNQYYQGPCMGQDRSSAAVDNVMTELQNMRRTAQSFNSGQRQDGNFVNSSSSTQSVESIKSELNDIEQEVQNLEQEQASPSAFVSNHNGYDASTGEASQSEFTSVNGSTPGNINSEGSMAESTSAVNGYANGAVNGYANGASNGAVNGYANGASNGAVNGYANESANGASNGAVNGSAESDHVSKLFDEEYEVVIKAQLTKKTGSDGPREPVERQIDVNKEASRRETTTVWGGTFGRKHV